MSYAKSAETRQAILDHIHVNPLQSANQISIAIGATRDSVQSCVKFMTDRGELEKIGSGMKTGYRAQVTTTISAEQVINEMQAKRHAAGIKAEAKEHGKTIRPGYYSQRGGDWQAKSGGGQASGRSRVYVCASAWML
jgi:hypothetical protein